MTDSVITPNGYAFVARKDWDKGPIPPPKPQGLIRTVYIHHTVTTASADPCADARQILRVLKSRNLLGYNFLIHPSGVVLELCGWNRGEHTANRNTNTIALSFIGNFERDQPTLAALLAAGRTISLGQFAGKIAPAPVILPHSSAVPTKCPGLNIRERRLPSLTPGEFASAVDWVKFLQAAKA